MTGGIVGPTARREEQGVRQLDEGETSHVAEVDDVGDDAHEGQQEGEAIDEPQKRLDDDYRVDELCQESLGDHGVLLDELGKVVEAGGCGYAC